jgi:ribosomal protein S18 acetylase RimI-like enzyme
MIDLGIDQWDESYPNRKIIQNDLEEQNYYVAILDEEIIAGIKIDQVQDPTYLNINWKDKRNKFIVVHRLCSKTKVWGKGVGKKMMEYAENIAVNLGCTSIRLDTYVNNPKAMAFYEHIGYTKLGPINLKPEKDIYFCFEKII